MLKKLVRKSINKNWITINKYKIYFPNKFKVKIKLSSSWTTLEILENRIKIFDLNVEFMYDDIVFFYIIITINNNAQALSSLRSLSNFLDW
jgi:hypothetical protein